MLVLHRDTEDIVHGNFHAWRHREAIWFCNPCGAYQVRHASATASQASCLAIRASAMRTYKLGLSSGPSMAMYRRRPAAREQAMSCPESSYQSNETRHCACCMFVALMLLGRYKHWPGSTNHSHTVSIHGMPQLLTCLHMLTHGRSSRGGLPGQGSGAANLRVGEFQHTARRVE